MNNNQASILNDAELEGASGGIANTSLDDISKLDGTSGTTLSRVKTSDKQQKAVLAFIKG
jgi:hypothetical protein